MSIVYRDLFAPQCSHHYGHLDDGPEPPHPLNSSCYMWWDRDCIEAAAMDFDGSGPQQPLPSIAGQESALHGLGHLQPYDPARVTALIE